MIFFLIFLIALVLPFGELLRFNVGSGIHIRALDIFVGMLFLSFFIQKRPEFSKVRWTVFAFTLVLIASLLINLHNADISATLYLVRAVVYISLLAFSFKTTFTKKQTTHLRIALSISLAITLAAGFIQYALYPSLRNLYYLGYDPHEYRLFGLLLDPNLTGIILVWGFFYFNHITTHHAYKKLLLALSVLALFLTYSRISWLSFIAGGLYYIKNSLTRVQVVIIGTAIFIFAILLLPRHSGEGTNLLRINSIKSKLTAFSQAQKIVQNKWLLGIGFNTISVYKKPPLDLFNDNALHAFDNSALTILVTTGTIGFITYLFLFISLWKNTSHVGRVFVLSFFIHSLSTNSFFTPTIFMYFIFVCWLCRYKVSRLVNK